MVFQRLLFDKRTLKTYILNIHEKSTISNNKIDLFFKETALFIISHFMKPIKVKFNGKIVYGLSFNLVLSLK